VRRRWVAVLLGAGGLAACSGASSVAPFDGPDSADGDRGASPGAGATMNAEGGAAWTTPQGGADASLEAAPDGASARGGADAAGAEAGAGPDAAPPDAGGPDAEAASEGGPRDAGESVDAGSCPLATSATVSYVDGAHGIDDGAHGAGPGTCAYKTITYAVAQGLSTISVASGKYSAATGETLPLVLTDRQEIACHGATIAGQGNYNSSTRATVVFEGTANGLTGCTIVGDDQPGVCVLVDSDGTKSGHDIESVDLGHCGDAAVRIQGTLVDIEDSDLHDSDRGVSWSANSVGDMSNNTLSNNAFDDLACDDGDDGVGGSNNTDSVGDLTCSGCDNCPFE
jgi:Protein of unknown function (DUF1565)